MIASSSDAAALLPTLSPRLKLAVGVLTTVVLASAAQPAGALSFTFQDIINNTDPTFNQELGINTAGTIAGYFGSGAAGHPNKGYTVVPPYAQANFTPENFPASVQTQVTGLNNNGVTSASGQTRTSAAATTISASSLRAAALPTSTTPPPGAARRSTSCSV